MAGSVISLGLSLGGGKAATSNGRLAGGAFSNQYSIRMDGSDDVIDVGDISSINSATNLTISGWFNASSFPNSSFNSLWGGGGDGGSNHPTRFWLSCNNGSSFRIYLGTSVNNTFAYSISTRTWLNVVLTVDGSAIKLFVNGSQVGSTYTNPHGSSLFSTAGDDFEIGANPTYRPYYWDGCIDEFAVFNSTLSASDITAIYNSGTPADLSSLSPVHWWRMGDNDGGTGTTITDQGSGGNDGTLTNGPTFSRNVPGGFNQLSVNFDGTDDFVDTGNKFDFMQQTLNFTISAWIKYTNHASTSANQYTLHTTDSSSRVGFMLWYDNRHGGKKIRTLISPTSSTKAEVTVNNAITDNNFHHFAVTCAAGGNYTLYIDGSSVGSASAPATSSNVAMHNFTLGAAKTSGGSSTLHFEGNLDEVAIFNSELSASNITAIYNSGVPNDISSLNPVSWWRMGDNDSGSGTTITDQGSGGNNGTLTNGPTFSSIVPS